MKTPQFFSLFPVSCFWKVDLLFSCKCLLPDGSCNTMTAVGNSSLLDLQNRSNNKLAKIKSPYFMLCVGCDHNSEHILWGNALSFHWSDVVKGWHWQIHGHKQNFHSDCGQQLEQLWNYIYFPIEAMVWGYFYYIRCRLCYCCHRLLKTKGRQKQKASFPDH